MKTTFTNDDVKMVSCYLQYIMRKYDHVSLTADQCAALLTRSKILPGNVGPKPGFLFRQMLRNGRDGLLDQVEGAFQQRPNTRWIIKRV